MPYNLVLSNGDALVTLADGVADNSYTSLTLFGKNFAGYGQFLNENFVRLLEHFCSSVPPFNPVVGQLWYDSLNHNMKVFNTNSVWTSLSGITASNVPPAGPNNGDGWWDVVNEQLFVWGSSQWILLGPKWNSIQGKSEAEAYTAIDVDGGGHTLLLFYINNTVVGIWNNDGEFVVPPEEAIGSFVTIPHGLSFDTLNVESIFVSGDQDIQGSLVVHGNITGDLFGNTTGIHYGNIIGETGTFTSLTSGRMVFAGNNGLLVDDGDLRYNNVSNTVLGRSIQLSVGLTTPSANVTTLTKDRITFCGEDGALIDSANLTFISSTGTLNVSSRVNTITVKSSSLTKDRITFAGDNGLLVDSQGLTFQSGVLRSTSGFAGSLTGDVTGNTTGTHNGPSNGTHTGPSNGTHTGPVTGDVTGNLTGNVTGNTTGRHTGYVCIPESPMTNNASTGLYFQNHTKTGLLWTDALYIRTENKALVIFEDTGVGFGQNVYMTESLGVNGVINCKGDIFAFVTSDRNLKTNIQPIENALSKVKKITGVCYDWTDDALKKLGGETGNFIRRRDTGVIAQEVESVLPEVVTTRLDGSKAVKYDKMVGLLIEAIKELSEEVEQLKNNKQ